MCVLRRPVCSLAVSAWQTVFTACAMHNTHTDLHACAYMYMCSKLAMRHVACVYAKHANRIDAPNWL